MNSPAGTSVVLNKAGYLVYMLGGCEDYLEIIGKTFIAGEWYYKKADLLC